MKTLPFILLFALVGCSRSEYSGKKMGDEYHQWIPVGTSLDSARQIMEQHQYVCSTVSYDNVSEITNDPDALQWTKVFIQKNGTSETVTNISTLICDWTDPNDKHSQRNAEWLMINNKTYQLLQWGAGVPGK